MKTNKLFWFQIVFLAWVVFTTLYMAYGEWNRFKIGVMENSYQNGFKAAVAQVIETANQCQPFPVTLEGQAVNLMALHCQEKQEEVKKK